MLRILIAAAALAAAPLAATAADAPTPPPEVQALGRMVQECQGREASALVQVFALQAQIADLRKQLAEARAGSVSPKADTPEQ